MFNFREKFVPTAPECLSSAESTTSSCQSLSGKPKRWRSGTRWTRPPPSGRRFRPSTPKKFSATSNRPFAKAPKWLAAESGSFSKVTSILFCACTNLKQFGATTIDRRPICWFFKSSTLEKMVHCQIWGNHDNLESQTETSQSRHLFFKSLNGPFLPIATERGYFPTMILPTRHSIWCLFAKFILGAFLKFRFQIEKWPKVYLSQDLIAICQQSHHWGKARAF